MRAFGLMVEPDLQGRWSVICRHCGTEVLLSHLADITTISAVLEPPASDFGVLETNDDTWQRLTIRRKDGSTMTVHDCQALTR